MRRDCVKYFSVSKLIRVEAVKNNQSTDQFTFPLFLYQNMYLSIIKAATKFLRDGQRAIRLNACAMYRS